MTTKGDKMNRVTGTINTKIIIGVLITLAVVVGVVAVVRLDVVGNKGGGLGKEFKYDVNKLTHIDPNLIIFEESGKHFDPKVVEAFLASEAEFEKVAKEDV